MWNAAGDGGAPVFTFQYVSINTGFGSLDEVFGYHLHSNMFLLIQYCKKPIPGDGLIYIPICFY